MNRPGRVRVQLTCVVADGTLVDTKGWKGWEWTHGVALTALAHVGVRTTRSSAKERAHTQHSTIDPTSETAQYSQKTALEWFELQYKLTNGKGAPKNINTMSPFYCLAELLTDGRTKDERWLKWCDEWAEWVMNDLPKTQEGGFQHSESRVIATLSSFCRPHRFNPARRRYCPLAKPPLPLTTPLCNADPSDIHCFARESSVGRHTHDDRDTPRPHRYPAQPTTLH